MLKSYLLAPLAALLLLAAPRLTHAQTGGVGIGTSAPDASAALDVKSTTQGLLPPRLTQPQRDGIGTPAAGLTIFNTSTNRLNTWNGRSWDQALSATETPVSYAAQTYSTPGTYSYTVPPGISQLLVEAAGASGGGDGQLQPGGLGGRAVTTLTVTAGEQLTVSVGGAGQLAAIGTTGGGGYNGGGNGSSPTVYNAAANQHSGGGGASDVRRGSTRLVVAGGGGGSSGSGAGGAAGYPAGMAGGSFSGGQGGSQTAAGTSNLGQSNGYLGQGGTAAYAHYDPRDGNYGDGGGGGYYGGGGGPYAGGGGSSYVSPTGTTGGSFGPASPGNGVVTLTPGTFSSVSITNVPGDNLGNHTATQNLNLASYQLVGNGGTAGLAIGSTGNVGIGTSSPGQKLDVSGNATVSGQLTTSSATVSGNAVVSGTLGLGTSAVAPATQKLDVRGNLRLGDNGGSSATGLGQTIEFVGPGLNTDPVGFYRTNPAADQSELRVVVGDASDAGDKFVVGRSSATAEGGLAAGTFTPSFTVRGDGNVGIGTPTPGQKLDVNGNATVSGNSYVGGNVGIGTTSPTQKLDVDGGILVRASSAISQQGANLQWNRSGGDGETWLLNQQGGGSGGIRFGSATTGNSTTEWARFDGNGNVGLGTTSPIAKLHVSGSASATPTGGNTSYFSGGSVLIGPQPPGGTTARATAAYFDGGQVWVNSTIVAGALNTTSDRRIKHVLGLSDRATDLALLNRLRITDYTYLDQQANPAGIIKKVIAQEVEQVLPTAVTRSTQAIPNVYEKATTLRYASGQLTVATAKPHELPATGGRMRFYTPSNQSLDVDVTVVDAHTVRFASPEAHAAGLFVYGKYVDDFRSVDYDALTTLNVSATQELARKVAALERQNASLQANANAIKAELQAVKAQAAADKTQASATLDTFETRLRRLEAGSAQAQR